MARQGPGNGAGTASPRRSRVRWPGVAAPWLLALGLASPAVAQFAPVQGREYKEFFNPVNPVRGEAVVGFAVLPTSEGVRSREIEVWLPGPFKGDLTVETLSADGRFRGEGVYRGASTGGWVRLALVGSSPSRPSDPATLALVVHGPESAVFIARWVTTPARPSERLRLYVNGRRADMFVKAGSSVAPCTPLKIPQPLRFDAYCDIDRRSVPPDGVLILIRRDQFDEQEQNFRVNIGGLP